MNSSTLSSTEKAMLQARPAFYWTLADTLVLTKRQLMHVLRIPDELVTSALQPVLFVVLFRYIFGGAIAVPGTSYVNYLIAGILVQSVILGSAFSGIGVATDLQRGLVDRFRSLPMAKSAVLTGRTLAPAQQLYVLVVLGAPRIGVKQCGGSPTVFRDLGSSFDVRQQRVSADQHHA